MKYRTVLILMGLGFFVCFTGFCYGLTDWVQDLHTGVYQSNYFEAFYETAGLLVYVLLGIRFIVRKSGIF